VGTIRTVVTAGQPRNMFLPGKQRMISLVSCWPNFTELEHNTSIRVVMKKRKLSEQNFENFAIRGRFSKKKYKNVSRC